MTHNALRRSPIPAAILVAFVALASMLAGSASGLLVTTTGASEALMRQAETPHLLQMHAGPVDLARLQRFAENDELVEEWSATPFLNVDGSAIRVTGDGVDTTLAPALQDNGFVTQSADFDFLLDTSGALIRPTPGTVWLPLLYRDEFGLAVGNTLTVIGPGGTTELAVAGFLRDSQMNYALAGSKRLLVADPTLAEIRGTVGDAGTVEHLIQFRLSDPAAASEVESRYREAGLEANGPTLTWSLFVLVNSMSDGITAAIAILVTVLLVAIALLCVRFTLLTTIEQDHREIGVLKAVGVRAAALRRLYSRRYLVMAVTGAAVGTVLSWGLTRLLVARVELYMGPSGRAVPAALLGVALAVLLVAIVALAVRRTLRALEHVSPVQAIRSGAAETGTGRRSPRWLTVARGPLPPTLTLGLADLWRRPGLHAVPLVILALASFILTLPQNLYTTMVAPGFVSNMGVGVHDMGFDVRPPVSKARVAEISADLAADDRVARHTVLVTAAYTTTSVDGARIPVKIESGDLAMFPVTWFSGTGPAEPGELALSALQAEALGAGLGDVVAVTPVGGGEPLELTVVGTYQDVTNGGRTAKMVTPHTSTEVMWTSVPADLAPGVDEAAVVEQFAAANPDVRVSSGAEYVRAVLGGTISSIGVAAVAALVVGLAVAALVTALFMRLLVTKDGTQIAVQRAIGVTDSGIQLQYVTRSVAVLVLGVVLGAVLANTVGGGLAGLLLAPVGLAELQLIAQPLTAYVATPLALLTVVVATTLAATRPTADNTISRTIKE
ncbi:FtsX-like permease family protein [Microlunatus sp. Y2014]|uniref:FtsX-like permease family protein n=1 Tax=Microlunatus sp. Y2014 TaxID=3418488 RepID=UPI003DA73BC4